MGLVHWDAPEGWDGAGGGSGGSGWGTHVNPWLIHVNVWQKPLQYCKVISLQLIKIIGGGGERHSFEGKLWHIKKQIHYFANKGLPIKAMVFPVVTYGCENWTIKKAEHQRFDAFEL